MNEIEQNLSRKWTLSDSKLNKNLLENEQKSENLQNSSQMKKTAKNKKY